MIAEAIALIEGSSSVWMIADVLPISKMKRLSSVMQYRFKLFEGTTIPIAICVLVSIAVKMVAYSPGFSVTDISQDPSESPVDDLELHNEVNAFLELERRSGTNS